MTIAVDPDAPLVRPIGAPRCRYRGNVREPVDPLIYLPVVIPGDNGEVVHGELVVTVSQAIEMMGQYTKAIGDFCRRGDVRAALDRTAAGSVLACDR